MIIKALSQAVKEYKMEKPDDSVEVIKSLVSQIQNRFKITLEDDEFETLCYLAYSLNYVPNIIRRTHPDFAQIIEKISDDEVNKRIQNINGFADGLFGLEGISQAHVEKYKFTIKILIAARNPEYEKVFKQILEKETKEVTEQFKIKKQDENIQRFLQERK
jgi:hypothetical protein